MWHGTVERQERQHELSERYHKTEFDKLGLTTATKIKYEEVAPSVPIEPLPEVRVLTNAEKHTVMAQAEICDRADERLVELDAKIREMTLRRAEFANRKEAAFKSMEALHQQLHPELSAIEFGHQVERYKQDYYRQRVDARLSEIQTRKG